MKLTLTQIWFGSQINIDALMKNINYFNLIKNLNYGTKDSQSHFTASILKI